jgi:hypothetical protein
MQPRVRNTIMVLIAMLFCVLSAGAGPNKDARIVVDQNADTKAVDSACAAQGAVHVTVSIEAAVSVTGFMMRVSFDSTVLKFDKAELVAPGSDAKPFLQTRGGVPGPALVKAIDGSTVDIADGVKSAEGVAVSGNGLLVYLTFTRLSAGICAVTVAKAQLSDAKLTIDKIIGK